MRERSLLALVASVLFTTSLTAVAQGGDSSTWLRVAQIHTGGSMVHATVGPRGAVLSLASGVRLEVPPRSTATMLRLSQATAEEAPCRLRGFTQIGDTLRIEGRVGVGDPATVHVASTRMWRSRSGHLLVMIGHRRGASGRATTVGSSQSVSVGASQTVTVGGNPSAAPGDDTNDAPASTGRWDGDYYITPARHTSGESPAFVASLDTSADFDSLHFGWIAESR